jgi:hypothetical protein
MNPSQHSARGLIKLYWVWLHAMDLVSITDNNTETYCMQQNNKHYIKYLLLFSVTKPNFINLPHSCRLKKYILFSLVIGPLTITGLFLSMEHKHNTEKYTFIHVVMFIL